MSAPSSWAIRNEKLGGRRVDKYGKGDPRASQSGENEPDMWFDWCGHQHGVDICLLSETLLNHGQDFRLAKYVCHRTERPTAGGGTAILVRRGIVHALVPVPGLTHLEATAVQVTLAGRPVKILAAYVRTSLLPAH